jgi:exportin-2 (importin alpha re-exporter)
MLWERQGNIPALVKLICSYIKLAPQQVVASDKLNAMLGVFQKLIASKANDHEGFKLIQCMVEYIPEQTLGQYMKPVFTLFFQRLTSSKTVKFIKGLLVFFGIYVLKYGASNLIQMIDGIQPKMFAMVVDRIFIPELQKVSGNTEKRTAAVGITKLLCESEAMFSGEYAIYWPPLLQALIGLFELPEDNVEALEEHFTEIEPEEGAGAYQAVYSQLVFAGKNDVDPLKETIPDAKLYLAQSLGKLSVGRPGKVRPVVSTIAPGAQTYLANYLQLANVQIS